MFSGPAPAAAQIAESAWRGDERCLRVVRIFTRLLGSLAGNLALTLNTSGGVYLAGGIVPGWGEHFEVQAFRAAFEDKPPFAGLLRQIPAFVVTHPQPGLLGLAELAGRLLTGRRDP
jgi:glucokinase